MDSAKVEGIYPHSEGVTVETTRSKYDVAKVVVTAGPWVEHLVPQVKKILKTRRLIMTWFAPKKNIKLFEPKHFPSFGRHSRGEMMSGAPAIDGNMIRISNNTNLAELSSPDSLDRNIPIDDLSAVTQTVKDYFPDLMPYPVRAAAFMDSFTPDKHPIVGMAPEIPHTIIACGFSGHGFKMAPVIGEIVKDLIEGNSSEFLLDFFSPDRFSN